MGLMFATTVTDEMRQKWEVAERDREAKLEYGRTVDDTRRLLKRAKLVRLWVRRDINDDALIVDITPAALRKSIRYDRGPDPMPCTFDPEDRKLSVGCWNAIHKARESV